MWMFPTPAEQGSASPDSVPDADYLGLIHAILEAEDRYEEQLAELALAMHLLGYKHPLTPSEYQRLFMFESNSPELADSQAAFHDLALDHVNYLRDRGFFSIRHAGSPCTPSTLTRFLTRLRNQWTIRAWYHTARKSQLMS